MLFLTFQLEENIATETITGSVTADNREPTSLNTMAQSDACSVSVVCSITITSKQLER